ncbi:unnamed protein product, partial [Oppiella nova]
MRSVSQSQQQHNCHLNTPSIESIESSDTITQAMDQMDDNNLRYELESRGQSIGPIVDSTRELYRRLLKRLMDEELDQLIGGQQEPIDADDDTEEEDEEEELDIHSVNSGAKTAIEPKSSF